jgi:Putative capsular polysaccharide synthesis protein
MTALQRMLSSRTVRLLRSTNLRRKRRHKLRDQFSDPTRPLLLILQMPKTGSQTVEATLRKNGWEGDLCRLHFVSPSWVAWAQQRLREMGPKNTYYSNLGSQVDLAETVHEVARLRVRLRRVGFDIPRLHVISAVREPVGVALSCVFEGHEHHFPTLESVTVPRCAELVQQFRYLERFQNWFDTELKPLTEIDVFQRPFPRERGFDIYENDLARVLVYRFENLPRLKEILETFLGCQVQEVVNANLSERKPYSGVYAAVKAQMRFPPAFAQAHCHSKMMRHFYSLEERQSFQTQWSQR